MNCDRFGELAVDLARSVPMDAAARNEAARHAGECPHCRELLERETALQLALANLALAAIPVSAALEERVLDAFDDHRRGRRPRRLAWIAAAACLALMAVAAAWIAAGPKQEVARVPMPAAPAPPELAAIAPPQPKMAAAARPARPARVVSPRAEPEADFVPLPFAAPLFPRERAQVLRVNMPRAALAGFGLPVNPEQALDSVRADLIVGEDNVARAIRFVPRGSSSATIRRVEDDQ